MFFRTIYSLQITPGLSSASSFVSFFKPSRWQSEWAKLEPKNNFQFRRQAVAFAIEQQQGAIAGGLEAPVGSAPPLAVDRNLGFVHVED
jgi:hypothetical protein